MSELKPCPFCGGAVTLKHDKTHRLGDFVCEAGTACWGSKLHVAFNLEDEASAIEAWNRRAQPAITPENGNTLSQGASAITSESVPLLSDDEVDYHIKIHNDGFIGGMHMVHLCRAVEAAVLAKRVPMTEAQINDAYGAASVQHDHIPHDDVARIARAVERHHGIVGEKGGA